MFNPTPQQDAIRRFILEQQGSADLQAVAGSGKTTTVTWATQFMRGTVALLAFNKKIALELQDRVSDPKRITAGTFHSFGLRCWKRMAPKCQIDEKKVSKLVGTLPNSEYDPQLRANMIKLISLAKQHMLTPDSDTLMWGELIEHYGLETQAEQVPDINLARDFLAQSNAQCSSFIDFDDMIYAPVIHGAVCGTYDWVIIDEAQDTNAARRALALKLMRKGGRLIAVGDPYQAIYGFTGADHNAMRLISDELGSTVLPLSVSFRCPQAVVREAQAYVPHIEASPAAIEGTVDSMDLDAFLSQTPDPTSVMLCRVTKPLVRIAYTLLGKGIACGIEGRDIGAQLIKLTQKVMKRAGRTPTMTQFLDRLDQYQQNRVAMLLRQERDTEAEALIDQCDAIRVVAEQFEADSNAEAIVNALGELFIDSENATRKVFTLSTVHKAKGREWDRVYLLGRATYMPSRWAKKAWEQEQERNLIYVALTRAKRQLTDVAI